MDTTVRVPMIGDGLVLPFGFAGGPDMLVIVYTGDGRFDLPGLTSASANFDLLADPVIQRHVEAHRMELAWHGAITKDGFDFRVAALGSADYPEGLAELRAAVDGWPDAAFRIRDLLWAALGKPLPT